VPFLPEQLESLDDKTTVLDCASSTLDAAPSTSPLSIFLFFPAFLSFLVFLAQQKVTRLSCIAFRSFSMSSTPADAAAAASSSSIVSSS
jgi:hypothetical protein